MIFRRVYSAADVATAERAIASAVEAGVTTEHLSLIARSDIELQAIPDDLKHAETDLVPAVARGAGYGAAAGLLAGLAAAAFPPVGVTLAGALLGGGAAGALVGSWASALVGASVPEPLRRHYEREIESGRILVLVDADEDHHLRVKPRFDALGLTELDVHGHEARET